MVHDRYVGIRTNEADTPMLEVVLENPRGKIDVVIGSDGCQRLVEESLSQLGTERKLEIMQTLVADIQEERNE